MAVTALLLFISLGVLWFNLSFDTSDIMLLCS